QIENCNDGNVCTLDLCDPMIGCFHLLQPPCPTATATNTATITETPTITPTPSRTPTVTNTLTPTNTPLPSSTPPITRAPTITSTPTITPTPGPVSAVSGRVAYYTNGAGVPAVEVDVSGTPPAVGNTDATGAFQIPGLATQANHIITPLKHGGGNNA